MRRSIRTETGEINTQVVIALIGAAATLLTAVIAGIFGLIQIRANNAQPTAVPVPTVVPLTVTIDGPADVRLNELTYFTLISENANRIEWAIAGFGRDEIDPFDQSEQIFVEPTNPDLVGEFFTLVVTAEDARGQSANARHRFQLVEGE